MAVPFSFVPDVPVSLIPKSEGHCLCGAITVTIIGHDFADGRARGHLCHCQTCRRITGADYAHNFRLRESQVVVTPNWRLSEHRGVTAAGNSFVRTFCSVCCSPITSKTLTPDFALDIVVRMGLFPIIPPPESEMCEDEKLDWLKDKIPDFWWLQDTGSTGASGAA